MMRQILLCCAALLMFSCAIQKRKYQKGFYIARAHHNTVPEVKKPQPGHGTPATKRVFSAHQLNNSELAAGGHPSETLKQISVKKKTAENDSCDILMFRDGSEIRAKVTEMGITDIKYKRCDNPDGPTYMTKRADLFMVKFSNGTREVMKTEPVIQKPAPPPPSGYSRPSRKVKVTEPEAPISFVASIFSVVSLWVMPYVIELSNSPQIVLVLAGLSLVAALVGIILSKRALNHIKEEPDLFKGKGLAIPASIVSWIVFGIWMLVGLIVLLLLFA